MVLYSAVIELVCVCVPVSVGVRVCVCVCVCVASNNHILCGVDLTMRPIVVYYFLGIKLSYLLCTVGLAS